MIITTTLGIENEKIEKYLGEAILDTNIFRGMFAAFGDIVERRSASCEREQGNASENDVRQPQPDPYFSQIDRDKEVQHMTAQSSG